MNNLSLLLADDHHLFRFGVRSYLERSGHFNIIGETDSTQEAIDMVAHARPDLVVMDVDLRDGNGVDATEQILRLSPRTNVLALSAHDDEQSVLGMLRAGAKGYLLKDAPLEELTIALRSIAKGNSYFSGSVSNRILLQLDHSKRNGTKRYAHSQGDQHLTERENEILQCIVEELTNKEIASKLFISPRTVETHRRNLIQKLNVKNSVGLVKYYLKQLHRHTA